MYLSGALLYIIESVLKVKESLFDFSSYSSIKLEVVTGVKNMVLNSSMLFCIAL